MLPQAEALAKHLRGLEPRPIYPRSITPRLAPQLDVFEIELPPDQAAMVDRVLHMGNAFATLLRVDAKDLRLTLQKGRVVIEVPSGRSFQPLAASALTVHPGSTIPLGLSMSGGVVSVNLASPNLAHGLVVGATGCGKSEALRTILYQLARASRAEFVFIDLAGQRRAFADFEGCARRLYPVMYDPTEGGRAIFDLLDELEERQKHPSPNQAPIWIAIDEVQRLAEHLGEREAAALLAPFAQRGRGANMHLLVATQYATAWAVGGPFAKFNLGLRLIGRVSDPAAGAYLAGAGSQVDRLRGKGQFLLRGASEALRVQLALVTAEDIQALPGGPSRLAAPGVDDDPSGGTGFGTTNGKPKSFQALLEGPHKSRQRQFSPSEWLLALQPGISCGMLQVLLRCGGNGVSRCRAEAQAWATGLQTRGEALPPLQVGAFSEDAQATIRSLIPNEEAET